MITGLHIGQVFDTSDPNQRGRVRVICATLFGSANQSNWVEPVLPNGYFSVPAVGSKVALIAENNDPRYVHYLGLSYSSSNKDGDQQDYPDAFDLATPGDQILLTNGSQSILIDKATGSVQVDGNLSVDGDLTVDGTIEATGNITSTTGDVIAGTVSLKTHVHSGVEPGAGVSGPPVP